MKWNAFSYPVTLPVFKAGYPGRDLHDLTDMIIFSGYDQRRKFNMASFNGLCYESLDHI